MEKCKMPEGFVIKPDGVHELDPCVYEDIQMIVNCTVVVSRCKRCGHVELSWIRNDDTEVIDMVENADELLD